MRTLLSNDLRGYTYQIKPSLSHLNITISLNTTVSSTLNNLTFTPNERLANLLFHIYIRVWIEKFIDWKIHMMSSYLLLMDFLTHEIKALQHCWKKCMDCKENMIKNIRIWTFSLTQIHTHTHTHIWLIDCLILTAFQPVHGNFMPLV